MHADGGVHMQARSRCSQDDGATRASYRRRKMQNDKLLARYCVGEAVRRLVLSRSSGRRLEGGLGTARCRGSDVLRRYGPTAAVGDRRERATLFRHTAHQAEASVVEF